MKKTVRDQLIGAICGTVLMMTFCGVIFAIVIARLL